MTSADIKAALVLAFPGTKSKDWKRISKMSSNLQGEWRTFAHPSLHGEVLTLERLDGILDAWGPKRKGAPPLPGVANLSHVLADREKVI